MIYAYFKTKDQQIDHFTLTGHAESGPAGHDLVCAAVSALAIGTINNLTRMASVEPIVEANEKEGGFLKASLPEQLDEKQKEYAQVLLQSLYLSLLDIEETYAEYIAVREEEMD